jgi:nicotinamidase-related amidase
MFLGWLVTRDRYDDAKKALRTLRGKHIPQKELDDELEESIAFTELEKTLEESTTYMDCFRGTDLRRTYIATLVATGQQFVGIAFISG